MKKKVTICTCDICGKEAEGESNFMEFFYIRGLQLSKQDLCNQCAEYLGDLIRIAIAQIRVPINDQ